MHLIIIILLGIEYYLHKTANAIQVLSFLNILPAQFLLYFPPPVLLAASYGELNLHHYEVCLFVFHWLTFSLHYVSEVTARVLYFTEQYCCNNKELI